MKKSLFAVAAATAFAGAAQAQSSVTVYGVMDVGVVGTSTKLPNSVNAAGGFPAVKTNSFALGQSAETTSRLGFRGTENLGGGTSAFFTAEFQLFPNDESLSGSASESLITGAAVNPVASNGGLLNRQAFVGLSQKGIGQFAIGTQYTPAFNLGAKTVAGEYNNVVGSVVYAANGSGTVNASFTNRLTNALTVRSENISGFVISGMYAANNATTSQTTTSATLGGTTNNTSWGLGLDFSWQKLFIGAAYQNVSNTTTAWTSAINNTPNSTAALASGSNYFGTNVSSNQALVGATYDFGILKAYVAYSNRKDTAVYNDSLYLKRTAQEIGVRGNITPTIRSWALVGSGKYNSFGTSQPSANFVGWQLGSDYILSKRTNLYAIYGMAQTSSTSSAVAGATTYPGGLAASASQYAIGVRHTF